ncbi:MAG: hypothetical protein IIA61_01695 [Candidatus Marinimicrobia bacterium]|nr:hypothetical protein [Candidatus Neomarinimicrobiota bacterium]
MKKTNLLFILMTVILSCTINFQTKTSFPAVHSSNPVIIIPGMLGSQLVDPENGNVIWGKIIDLKAVGPHEALINEEIDGIELPTNLRPIQRNRDRLIPSSIITRYKMVNRIMEVKIYQGLVETLSSCGLREGDIQKCTAQDNLFLFPYDWRRDLVESAVLLGERIEEIKRVYHNPDQRVTIIAHSMGGLIAKYYLMYGQKDVLTGINDNGQLAEPDYSGAKNVDKVFFLGTPYHGSVFAFKTLHEGTDLMPFVSISRWATFTMPSLYQMLPLDSKTFIFNEEGNPIDFDLYDVQTWIDYGISIFNEMEWDSFEQQCSIYYPDQGEFLAHQRRIEFVEFVRMALERGKYFNIVLNKLEWDSMETEHYIIAGNCNPTLSGVILVKTTSGKNEFQIVKKRIFSNKYFLTDMGDKTVLYRDQSRELNSADDNLTGCFIHYRLLSYPEVQQMIIQHL